MDHRHSWHRTPAFEDVARSDRTDVHIAHVCAAPRDACRRVQRPVPFVILDHYRDMSLGRDRHDPVRENKCDPEVSVRVQRATIGHSPPPSRLQRRRVAPPRRRRIRRRAGCPARGRTAPARRGRRRRWGTAPHRRREYVRHRDISRRGQGPYSWETGRRWQRLRRRRSVGRDAENIAVGGSPGDGVEQVVGRRADRTPQGPRRIRHHVIQPLQWEAVHFTAQQLRDVTAVGVQVLEHTGAEVRDEEVPPVVDSDAVGLAAGVPDPPDLVLAEDFCDSRALI